MPLPLSPSDLRGIARLTTDAVVGATDVTEAMHATIARPFSRRTRTGGITGMVYRTVRGVSRGVGVALQGALAVAEVTPLAQRLHRPDAPARDALVAVLNGVLGDTLAAQNNPLATTMHFRHRGRPLSPVRAQIADAVPAPSSTLLVQVHGICMHDGQLRNDSGDACAPLAKALGATLISLRYNTGRHISANGDDFARALHGLVTAWPRPVRRLVIVGHSMGGLVARSAFYYGNASGHDWPQRDASLVMLGSPHHGTHLERLGNGFETLLHATPYASPLARLGRIRSAGVTDLRFGNITHDDWAGSERFERGPDRRRPVPLPAGVACYRDGSHPRRRLRQPARPHPRGWARAPAQRAWRSPRPRSRPARTAGAPLGGGGDGSLRPHPPAGGRAAARRLAGVGPAGDCRGGTVGWGITIPLPS
jgi:hypothetical protein